MFNYKKKFGWTILLLIIPVVFGLIGFLDGDPFYVGFIVGIIFEIILAIIIMVVKFAFYLIEL